MQSRPSRIGNIIFWTLWVVLLVLSFLILIALFSIPTLIIFALLIALPILLKRILFGKWNHAVFTWLGLFLVFFVTAVLSTPSHSLDNGNRVLVTDQFGEVTVSVLDGILSEGQSISVSEVIAAGIQPVEGLSTTAYEISLPEGVVMEGVAKITLPYSTKALAQGVLPKDGICAAYYDEAEDAWTVIPFIIDPDLKTVTIFTTHFSRYAVAYYRDGRANLGGRLPEFDSFGFEPYSISQLTALLDGMAQGGEFSDKAAFEAGWSSFCTYYGLTDATGSVLAGVTDSKLLTSISNMTRELGGAFAIAQLAMDIANGDNNAAVNNLIKNASFYSASKWGSAAIGIASAGATFIDISLNQYAQAALDKNLQKWQDAYWKYYTTDSKMQRNAVGWYEIVKELHQSSTGPEDFKTKLDTAVTAYCDIFWNDPEGYAYLAEKTEGIRGFGGGGEYTTDVMKLRDNLKSFIYSHTIKQVMEVYTRKLWIDESIKADKALSRLLKEMNKEYTLAVELANAQSVKDLSNTKVSFINSEGRVAHSQSFDLNGKATIKITLFGFLKGGCPTNVVVSVPAQDNTPAFETTLTYQLAGEGADMLVSYTPTEAQPSASPKPNAPASSAKPTVTPSMTPNPSAAVPTPADEPEEYDYHAALAAWMADYAATQNAKTFDDGKCKTTCDFEWVMVPTIKDGSVYGASRLWYNDKYYAGPKEGTTERYVASETYDATNPGIYITLDELKKAYPNF